MGKATKPIVALRPPLELIQPRPTAEVPAEDALPGGVQYEVKLDGIRALAWSGPDGVELWSRRGNQLTGRYPELMPALAAALPPGVTLDGEICAWTGERLDFHQLLRSPERRSSTAVALSYVAWDVLSTPGDGDVRQRPLAERRSLLVTLLDGVGPQVQAVMATRSRNQALLWYDGLEAAGVEGLVAKSLAGRSVPTAPARTT